MKIFKPSAKFIMVKTAVTELAGLDTEPPSPTQKQLRRAEKKRQKEEIARIAEIKRLINKENREARRREIEDSQPMTLNRRLLT